MRLGRFLPIVAAVMLAFAIGCSSNKASTPDIKDRVAKALGDAGFKDLNVTSDNDKQLVTIKGDVKTQEEKERAEDVAKGAAGAWVVANEIGVRPEGVIPMWTAPLKKTLKPSLLQTGLTINTSGTTQRMGCSR
jgi:BON domain